MSSRTAPPRMDVSGTPGIPFARLLKVELRKTANTLAGIWLLGTIAILVLLAEGTVTILTIVQGTSVALGDFVGVAAYLTSVLLPILGIMLVTSEWSQRTAMVTFALEPRRVRVILAKLVVGFILTLLTAIIAVALGVVCTLLCEIFQPDTTSWDLGTQFLLGFLITQTLAMTGGFALATLLLNTPASIVLFAVYRYVLPGIFAIGAALIGVFHDIRPWIDFQNAQVPIYDWTLSGAELWGNLIVSGLLWLGLPLGLGLLRILRAEVK